MTVVATTEYWDYIPDALFFKLWRGVNVCGSMSPRGRLEMYNTDAKYAREQWVDLPRILGIHVKKNGNIIKTIPEFGIFSFPVYTTSNTGKAEPRLVSDSLDQLKKLAEENIFDAFIIRYPGREAEWWLDAGKWAAWEVADKIHALPENVFVLKEKGDRYRK